MSLSFDVLFLILRLLPEKDRVRVSRTCHSFQDAVRKVWTQQRHIPQFGCEVPASALIRIVMQCHKIRVFDFDMFPVPINSISGQQLAQSLTEITCFKSVRLSHIPLVAEYARSLLVNRQPVHVSRLELILDDWQQEMPFFQQQMLDLVDSCDVLDEICIQNLSYGLLHEHGVWRLIGSRIKSLQISCPYICVVPVFQPTAFLKSISSPLTQSAFDLLCQSCPLLERLEEKTFYRETLPDHNSVLAVQSDPTADSDLILDLEQLHRLKFLKHLTLTSLISNKSRQQLHRFLMSNGRQLQSLDLNLSNGDMNVLKSVFSSCTSLSQLVVYFDFKSYGPTADSAKADVKSPDTSITFLYQGKRASLLQVPF